MTRRPSRVMLALLVAATSVGAACGDSASEADVTAAATQTPAASEAAPTASAESTTTAAASATTAAASGSDAAAPSDSGPVTHWQHHSDARAALVKDFIKSYADAGGATSAR